MPPNTTYSGWGGQLHSPVKLIHPGMLLTLVAALALASPYIFWLSEHPAIGLHARSKLMPDNKQSSFGLIEFGKAILFFASPVLLVTTIFFPFKHWQLRQTARNYLLLRYHLISLPLLASIFFLRVLVILQHAGLFQSYFYAHCVSSAKCN